MSGVEKFFYGVAAVVILVFLFRGCSQQSMTRNWGGDIEVSLEPNQKLIEVTWKDDSLWFLTKSMTSEDVAENYQFYEKSPLGLVEGCVYINEVKMSEEEIAEYESQMKYATDFYNSSNYNVNGEPVYIEYNVETNTYKLLKPYEYNEYGELIPTE